MGAHQSTLRLSDKRRTRPGKLRLVVLGIDGPEVHALPSTGSIVLGRGPEADLRIDEPSISRKHARLHLTPELALEDLGSANGSRVRETTLRAGEPQAFAPGEPLELGGALMVVQPASQKDAGNERSIPLCVPAHPMEELSRLVARVAQSELSIVILGETGVGKSQLAGQIHEGSPRAKELFLSVNCGAMAESLLESELFGTEKGAFTGAVTRAGLFETAHGGTLLLDEVGDMPASMQPKLLEVLEEKRIRRVGGIRPVKVDVRVLAATHRDLKSLVASGKFREDLWYRLAGVCLMVPALRERRDEISTLAHRFASGVPFSKEALALLEAQDWPGNIRELKNAVERAAVLSEGEAIRPEHLGLGVGSAASKAGAAPTDERARVIWALDACAGNQTAAAKLLGISRRTIVNKMKQYGLPRPRGR